MWQLALAGLSLGLLGSLHCVGMCGPLALSLPMQHLQRHQQFIALVCYNAGRVITYSLMGLVLGLAVRGIYLAGWQQWFSIVLGTVVLLFSARFFLLKKICEFINNFFQILGNLIFFIFLQFLFVAWC